MSRGLGKEAEGTRVGPGMEPTDETWRTREESILLEAEVCLRLRLCLCLCLCFSNTASWQLFLGLVVAAASASVVSLCRLVVSVQLSSTERHDCRVQVFLERISLSDLMPRLETFGGLEGGLSLGCNPASTSSHLTRCQFFFFHCFLFLRWCRPSCLPGLICLLLPSPNSEGPPPEQSGRRPCRP